MSTQPNPALDERERKIAEALRNKDPERFDRVADELASLPGLDELDPPEAAEGIVRLRG